MRYYYPDYFNDFKCVGGKACPDSCCIIWQINVDKATLKKYKTVDGELGRRMAEKIDQKTGKIMQHGDDPWSSSFSVLSFCLSLLFMGFSRQEY